MLRSILLSIILSLASLAGHAQATYAEELSEITRLRGRVKQVSERSYFSETNTDSLPHLKYKPFGTQTYLLGTSSRLIKWTVDGGHYGTEVCHYRYHGDTVIRTLYNNKRFQRRLIAVQDRDGQGRIGQARYFVEDDRGVRPLAMVRNTYDTSGYLTAQVHFGASGEQYAETHFENDNRGNHLQLSSEASESGGLFYTYDDQGNPVTEHHSAPEGAMSYPDMRYRYLYDGQGNWIQKTTAFGSGEIKEVTTRTITYWP